MKNAGLVSIVVIGLLGFILSAALLNGFMLSYLWEWFVVPLGVRSIGIVQAIGIALIVSMLTYRQEKSEEAEEWPIKLMTSIAAKLVAFGIAYGLSLGIIYLTPETPSGR